MTQRRQPDSLQQTSMARAESTLRRIEQALAHLDDEQRRVPRDERQYPTAAILVKAAELRPDLPPIHRSTLSRNVEARQLIAQWRAHYVGGSSRRPNFEQFAGWRGRKGTGHSARYGNRLRSYSLADLAERVVGMEELHRHCLTRREQIECVMLPDGSWPQHVQYPLDRLCVSEDAQRRYQSNINTSSKDDLIRLLVQLERAVQEHQAHLAEYDSQYVASAIK